MLKSLLVGVHFHPPAKLILASLPAGTPVSLVPEPENPYDPDAIQVYVDPSHIPASERPGLELALPGMGQDLVSILTQDSILLGHVAATGGKPLLKAGPGFVGTLEFAGLRSARLGFSPDGSPTLTAEKEANDDQEA
jgi:hypothetical protein